MILGIEASNGLVFEGTSKHGVHLIWPSPVMTPAKFAEASSDKFEPENNFRESQFYFREDFFDPISRIRRGRFYKSVGNSGTWDVFMSPNIYLGIDSGMLIPKHAAEYQPYSFSQESAGVINIQQILVMMGTVAASTIWAVTNVETILTGEELVTLKARQSFGVLPDVNWMAIPDQEQHNISQALQTLEDDYHIASPESVVDRANEAATRVLNAYLKTKGKKLQDTLSKITGVMSGLENEDKKEVAKNAADIVRLLHGRTKYAVQKIHNTRPIREQDAELSVQCLGVMLCDLGWGRWL